MGWSQPDRTLMSFFVGSSAPEFFSAPPLLAVAVLRFITRWSLGWRMTIGAVTTLAVFVPVNLSRVAADFVCRAVEVLSVPLGIGAQRIASDPTDLIALPMIGLAVWYARKVNPCVASSN